MADVRGVPLADTPEAHDPRIARLVGAALDGIAIGAGAGAQPDAAAKSAGLIRELEVLASIRRALQVPVDTDAPTASARAPAGAATEARLTEASPVPDAWGPLRIVRQVGRGSFGRVFEAVDTRLDRQVALKLLDAVPVDSAANVVPEARLLAQVRHENVVTVFGADYFAPAVGLWMEFVHGRTLRALCNEQDPFSAAEALLVGLDVSRALAAVHRAGFVHGDIKAQNVMRQAGGRIVLTDFGAARLIRFRPDGRHGTATPYYAAPELFLGGQATVRTDMYALGVLLYFLVTGRFPVTGGSPGDILLAHINGHRTRLRDLRPDLPSAFVHVVDAATAMLPEDRPDSAGALEALLERATGRVSTVARPPTTMMDAIGPATSASTPSIAVLPFTDMSADRHLAPFCEGLAEEVIHALSGIPGLRVVPRTSAFSIETRRRSAKQLGTALKVTTVLQGSVRASGTRLRVGARLTDAVTGTQIWSQLFDRELSDLFGVQADIATAVCQELGVQLRRPLATSATADTARDADAYALYLKGRYCWNQRTELALHKSVTCFQEAIDKDPDYAPAYAALAEALTTLGLYGVVAPNDIMPRARAAARRAVELEGSRSTAHVTTACIAAVYDWDWSGAARGYHRAMEANPAEPSAHHWYAINYLVPRRRFDEAAVELQRAADADPLSMPIRATFGLRSYFAHEFARAHDELRACLEVDPGSSTARLFLGLTLVEQGHFDEAIHELETASGLTGSPEMTAALGYACARAGRLERGRALLGELLLFSEERYLSPSLVAQVHAGFGSTDAVIEWLERAVTAHAADLAWIGVRPVFDSLRAEPRFNGIVARVHHEP